jgi:hypothetical protein
LGSAGVWRVVSRRRTELVDHRPRSALRAVHRVLGEGLNDAFAPAQNLAIPAHGVLWVPACLACLVIPLAPRLDTVQAVVMNTARISGQDVLQQKEHEAIGRTTFLFGLATLLVLVLEQHVLRGRG